MNASVDIPSNPLHLLSAVCPTRTNSKSAAPVTPTPKMAKDPAQHKQANKSVLSLFGLDGHRSRATLCADMKLADLSNRDHRPADRVPLRHPSPDLPAWIQTPDGPREISLTRYLDEISKIGANGSHRMQYENHHTMQLPGPVVSKKKSKKDVQEDKHSTSMASQLSLTTMAQDCDVPKTPYQQALTTGDELMHPADPALENHLDEVRDKSDTKIASEEDATSASNKTDPAAGQSADDTKLGVITTAGRASSKRSRSDARPKRSKATTDSAIPRTKGSKAQAGIKVAPRKPQDGAKASKASMAS